MNTLKTSALITIVSVFALTCCNKKTDNPEPSQPTALEIKTFRNLHAPQFGGMGQPVAGKFTKFSFAKGDTVADESWDIAFRGLTIIVNGGTKIGIIDEPERTGLAQAAMLTELFEDVKTAPNASTFKKDSIGVYALPTGSGNGWYNYSPATNLVTPIAGRVFVIKTHDEKYAKIEILSYYKDAPVNPTADLPSRYYTFRYVYQPDGNLL